MKLTIEELGKKVAEQAKKELEINNMPIEVFLVQIETVAEFLQSEIELADELMKAEYNHMFKGVEVGKEKQIELNRRYKMFCNQILKMLGVDEIDK